MYKVYRENLLGLDDPSSLFYDFTVPDLGSISLKSNLPLFSDKPDIAFMPSPATIELSTLDGTSGFVVTGQDAGDRSGLGVSNAGDVNGDGIDDFLVGAAVADPDGRGSAGEVYVVFGTNSGFPADLSVSTLDGTNGFTIFGRSSVDQLGVVSSAGDFNGDGIDDIIVGAPSADPGLRNAGEVYVLFGSDTGFAANLDLENIDSITGLRITGHIANLNIGRSISDIGDINDDGVSDIIISGEDNDEAYLLYGSDSGLPAVISTGRLNSSNGFTITGPNIFGDEVSGAGDINGDGIDDFMVGANNFSSTPGTAYIVFGNAAGFGSTFNILGLNGTDGFIVQGADANAGLGSALSRAGDVNGDGIDDIIIAAPRTDVSGDADIGAAYVIFGSTMGFDANFNLNSLDGTNGFAISGPSEGLRFGGVAGGGDFNGDGFADVIVASPFADPGGRQDAGSTYVIFGRADGFGGAFSLSIINGINGMVLNGVMAGDNSGLSADFAGDVNGDGIDDIIIGAYQADPNGLSGAGSSYVIYGSASFGPQPTPGTAGDDNLMGTAAGDTIDGLAGDDVIDGLGGDDVLIGGAGNDTLIGGDGDDILNGGTGADILRGDAGTDTADYRDSSAGIRVSLTTRGLSGDAAGDTYDSIEQVFGTAFIDSIMGSMGDDLLDGGDGNDALSGLDGDDTLLGGNGNDRLFGGLGADTISGGAGIDVVAYSASLVGVTINLETNVNLGGDAAGDILESVERVVGSFFDDMLTGDDADNLLNGLSGNDIIFGGNGADRLYGLDGTDRLDGGFGSDRLFGGDGEDHLTGGGGLDRLNGGDGDDIFSFGLNHGRDYIEDFVDGEDMIEYDGTAMSFADLLISQFGTQVLIESDAGTIYVNDADAANFTADDFTFM